MGKTVQRIKDFGQLASLRQGAATPDYARAAQPDFTVDLTNGYWHPKFIFDTFLGADDDQYLRVAQACYLAPLAAVCPGPDQAIAKQKEAVKAVRDCPRFDAPEVTNGSTMFFRPRFADLSQPWTLPGLVAINETMSGGRTVFEPKLPLLGTRIESSGPGAWAVTTYSYDAYRAKWFFVSRLGRRGASAYDAPFTSRAGAKKAAARQRESLRESVRKIRRFSSTSVEPLLNQSKLGVPQI